MEGADMIGCGYMGGCGYERMRIWEDAHMRGCGVWIREAADMGGCGYEV